ncbi:5565_t:CDS:2, partial [Acaulospora colombiana]
FEKEYMSDDSSESDNDSVSSSQIRQDFSHILDEFIEKYEVTRNSVSKKEPIDDKLEQEEMNQSLLHDRHKVEDVINHRKLNKTNKDGEEFVEIESERSVRKRQPWDCQSILSTYSNLENHPTLIREKPRRKIKIDKQTGLPIQEQESDDEKSPNNEKDVEDKEDNEAGIKEENDQTR